MGAWWTTNSNLKEMNWWATWTASIFRPPNRTILPALITCLRMAPWLWNLHRFATKLPVRRARNRKRLKIPHFTITKNTSIMLSRSWSWSLKLPVKMMNTSTQPWTYGRPTPQGTLRPKRSSISSSMKETSMPSRRPSSRTTVYGRSTTIMGQKFLQGLEVTWAAWQSIK